MKLQIVAPSRREAAVAGTGALVCGGGAAAGQWLDAYLASNAVDAVLFIGLCGGLDPSLSAGDLILARGVVAPDQPDLGPDPSLFAIVRRALQNEQRPFVSSQLLTVGRPAARRRDKVELWNRFGAAGVDMETSVLAQAAEAHNVRWLALRTVLDPASEELPAAVRSWRGEVDEAAIARRLARSPLDWPAAARLALQMQRALGSLRQTLPSVREAAASLLDVEMLPDSSRLALQR